jgi:D-arabinonate dehydratase
MLDANNAYPDAKTAIKAGHQFEAYNIQWLEEPVMPDNIQASAEIKAALEIPIATGEIEGTRWGFRDLIEKKAADILQPDVTVVGGITEWMKVAHMASGWDIPVAPHYFWDIHVHLVAATSNSLTVEYFLRESDIVNFDDLLIEPLQPVQGFLEVPQKPGLGIDLNEEAVQRFEIK